MVNRLSKNVPGDFYTNGECLACELPEMEAPELLAPLTGNNYDTYFVKQPETKEELDKAISACEVCCVSALRYGGKDKEILNRLDSDCCDYKIDSFNNIIPNNKTELIKSTPIVEGHSEKKRWWKFW